MLSRSSWGYLLLIASVIAICIATISPFNFVLTDGLSKDIIIESFRGSTNIKDYIRNILLFTSFGVACAKISSDKKYRLGQILTSSFLLGAFFSFNIELIQILLPSRVSSFSDIVCNGLGSLLGAVLYYWRKDFYRLIYNIFTRNYHQVNLKLLAAIIFSYIITTICGWFLLINSINLNSWNNNAHLAVASEVTRKVFWRGYVTSLYVCDRAIEQSQIAKAFEKTDSFFSESPDLVTSFLFLNYQPSYVDNNSQTPDLLWTQKLPSNKTKYFLSNADRSISNESIDRRIHNNKTVLFEKRNSLISAAPAINLNQQIKAAQEFTLSIILATNKLKQVGPARIISLGENIDNRNILLGQEDSNLVFRLRTPITGETAAQPGFYIPDFFQDTDLHHILITFGDRQLTFYLDNPDHQYTFTFQPSTLPRLFLPLLLKQWNINLVSFNLLRSKIVFYSLVFTPLAMLIFLFVLCSIQKDKSNTIY